MSRLYTLLAAFLLLCLCWPAAADDAVYSYKKNGVRVFSDRKPSGRPYTRMIFQGRPTATASCQGLTPAMLDARADRYQELIHHHAKTHAVPATLVRAVMRVESCFDAKAVSRAGARGLMQLMPDTARELGVRNSFDAGQNISGGVRYLRQMLERFNHDTQLALAAYNAGPNAVTQYRGIPPYAETQKYVTRVMAAYRQNNQREAAGEKTQVGLLTQ